MNYLLGLSISCLFMELGPDGDMSGSIPPLNVL